MIYTPTKGIVIPASEIAQSDWLFTAQHYGVCIDDGLYMVAETLNGIHYTVHVQKSILGKQTQILACDSKSFEYMNTVASISDKGSYECPHLLSIQYITNCAKIINLDVSVLDKMVLNFFIKPESKDASKYLNDMAKSVGKILDATWEPLEYQSERKIFISVRVGKVHHNCKSGRVTVTFDLVSHSLSCQCSHSTKKGCLHKNIAKWHIYQNNPYIYQSTGIIADNSSHISLNVLKVEANHLDYNKMADCLTKYKMLPLEIPIEFLKETFNNDIVLKPAEKECIYCKTIMSEKHSTEKGIYHKIWGL